MHARPARRLALAVLAAALLLPACSRRRGGGEGGDAKPDDAPAQAAAPVTAPRPAGQPAKPAKDVTWGGGPAIPLSHNTPVTLGVPGCPIAVVGQDVWDLKTFKAIRRLPEQYEVRGLRALSPDGRYFAAASKSPNQTETAVSVWDVDTGGRALDLPPRKDAYTDLIRFISDGELAVGGRHDRVVEVWNVEQRQAVGRLTVPGRRVEGDKLAFTPDGKYAACIDHDKAVVVETTTSRQVAVMAPPATGTGAVFVFAWARGLAFSPDGTELALFSTHPAPHVLVWDTKGTLVMDAPVQMPSFVGPDTRLEWLPDGRGWLVGGCLFERASRRVLLNIRSPFASSVQPHALDAERVAGTFGRDDTRLQVVPIPWDKLTAAVQAMAAGADAYLAPGQAVSLDLQLTGLRGNEAETRQTLTDALTKRLARDGIGVAAGRPTVLRLRLSEQAGDALPIFERQTPFDFKGRDTGRKATEAKGAAVLELVAQGVTEPLWRGRLAATSSRSFQEEINDATIRKSMMQGLSNQLNSIDVPYFLPKSRDVLALPAVIE